MRISDWSSDVCSSDLLKVKAGIDPLEERQREAAEALAAAQAAQVAGVTFKTVAETYIATNEGSWRNDKHRQQWKNTLATYVYPVIGELPVAEVRTRSEEHTSELQSLMRISYAVICLKKKTTTKD